MASQDVLSLSLDDIIKMKNKRGGRGGGARGRGRGRGGGAAGGTDQSYATGSRGRGWARSGGIRGQSYNRPGRGGRGRGVLSSRGRGIISTRVQERGIISSKIRGRGVISTRVRRGVISMRARGRGGGGRGGGGAVSIRARRRRSRAQRIDNHNTTREWHQQADTRDISVRQQIARKKVEQARRTLALTKQAQSRQARQDLINAHRGNIVPSLSRGNLGTPLRVRVGGSGAIVRGLRSDQLLLNKIRQGHKAPTPTHTQPASLSHQRGIGGETTRGGGSLVSLTSQRGLTVSIKNNIASHGAGSGGRSKPNLNRGRTKQYPSGGYSSHTFTVVNDRVQPVEPQVLASPPSPRRPLKRNFITTADPRMRNTMMTSSYSVENSRPIPEAHRQLLDPKVQKEIAMLQGKGEVVLNNGPGPGVKGLRHIPSQTSRSLNERFTEERMVTD